MTDCNCKCYTRPVEPAFKRPTEESEESTPAKLTAYPIVSSVTPTARWVEGVSKTIDMGILDDDEVAVPMISSETIPVIEVSK